MFWPLFLPVFPFHSLSLERQETTGAIGSEEREETQRREQEKPTVHKGENLTLKAKFKLWTINYPELDIMDPELRTGTSSNQETPSNQRAFAYKAVTRKNTGHPEFSSRGQERISPAGQTQRYGDKIALRLYTL